MVAMLFVVTACPDETPASTSASSSGAMDTGGDDDGASSGASVTSAADSSGGTARYHPDGFAEADVHGPALKLHEQDCRGCHGPDLMGGSSEVSCDSCHEPQWRTDCVYCHGGTMEASGAPPRDIDGTDELAMLSFIAHPRHVSMYQHAPYDCIQCHRKPVDVLSEGHVFDDTDARAEVDFSAGISPTGQWDGQGGCSSLYCHGDGLSANGSYAHDMPTPDCGGCHPFPGTANLAFASMSGEHARHTNEGIGCQECHDPVAIESHVDGAKNVAITAAGFTFDAEAVRCTGLCHLEAHTSEGW